MLLGPHQTPRREPAPWEWVGTVNVLFFSFTAVLAVQIFFNLSGNVLVFSFSTLVSVANTEAGQMETGRIGFHLCM